MKRWALVVSAAVLGSGCGGTAATHGVASTTDAGESAAVADAAAVAPDGERPTMDGPTAGSSLDAAPGPAVDAGAVVDGPATSPAAGPWARGVKLGVIEVSQGVFIKVGEGATAIDRATWKASLLEARPLFVRAYITPEAGFMARPLRAVLSLQGAGGAVELEDQKMVSGPSNPEDLATTFNVLFPASAVKPGVALTVSLYEAGMSAAPEPASPPRFPTTGAADLGIMAGPMEIDVVLVPASTKTTIADTPARRQQLENTLYDLYPVQKVNLIFHAPITLPAVYTDETAPWDTLRQLRTQEHAPAWQYYHMLIAAQDIRTGGVTGSAVHADPGVDNDGSGRVAWTRTNDTIDGAAMTTAHEIGHNLGRPHTPGCGAGGPDPMYPYPPGEMGTNGYSLTTSTLKSQTRYHELMAYCNPRWVGDYVWQKFFDRVRALSAIKAASH